MGGNSARSVSRVYHPECPSLCIFIIYNHSAVNNQRCGEREGWGSESSEWRTKTNYCLLNVNCEKFVIEVDVVKNYSIVNRPAVMKGCG